MDISNLQMVEPFYMIQYEDLKKKENVRLDNILLIQFKDLKLKLKKNTDFFHVNNAKIIMKIISKRIKIKFTIMKKDIKNF
jgi:hypothetical protein